MTTYRIKLTVETPSIVVFHGRDVFRVKITASDAENMSNDVFVHQKTLVDPRTEEQENEFVSVAGPYDLAVYPAGSPNLSQDPPFFRLAVLDVLLPSVSLAASFIEEVQAQVATLLRTLEQLDLLESPTVTWIPSAPTTTTTTTTTTAAP